MGPASIDGNRVLSGRRLQRPCLVRARNLRAAAPPSIGRPRGSGRFPVRDLQRSPSSPRRDLQERDAAFFNARFEDATLEGSTVRVLADFAGATFAGAAGFHGARFEDATFVNAIFGGGASFSDASFEGRAEFTGAHLERDRDFGPVRAGEALALDGDRIRRGSGSWRSASTFDCSRAQFRRGADIFVRRAAIVLDDADFAAPSMLAPWRDPVRGEEPAVREGPDEESAPRLVSIRRTKGANLTITGADLRACRFEGAHGLDRLRLERVRFARRLSGWQRSKRSRVPSGGHDAWRSPKSTTGARTSGLPWVVRPEVREVRAPSAPRVGPFDIGTDRRDVPRPSQRPGGQQRRTRCRRFLSTARWRCAGRDPVRVRRSGLLAVTAPPSMQAPRASLVALLAMWGPAPRPGPSVSVLRLYWLVSGYGLRASRALIALALTVVVFAFLLDLWGFRPDQSFGRALLFSLGSTSSLFELRDGGVRSHCQR